MIMTENNVSGNIINGLYSELLFSYAGYYRHSEVLWHSHRGIEVIYVAKGECVCKFEKHEDIVSSAGDCIVVPPELSHGQADSADCETRYIVFEDNKGDFECSLRKIEAADDPLIGAWFEQLFFLNKSCEFAQATFLLATLLLRLDTIEKKLNRNKKLHPALNRAVEYIESNLARDIPVSELARRCGVSQGHLNLLFQTEFGAGANHYILSKRMRLARQLLLNTYYTISEVAGICGFSGGNYFTRAFKQYYGVTPGKYREAPSASADCLFDLPLEN